ncbi:Glycosyltransferase involved in cell wall bisynthesis [Paracidovorax valerianellae]|uniref:Glycosyltransferase involved in cell wall bisynthesis n=2 Tax=Paracidovorax valerianellae TaxID=187868 RepID=A0A1G6TEA2_9BURK|nr:Glycosyltransferase involved in cell wall bisynthesis [Paracidovorax valerianellae]
MALRVLHIGKFYPPYLGGMEVFLADLIEAQRAQGIEASALVHGTPLPDDPPWLERVPVQFNLVYAPIALGFRSALGRAIRRFQPDVLHLHLPNNSALWALTLPAARKVPCVVHWHSDIVVSDIKLSVALAYFLYRPFEHAVLDRAQLIFATSPPYLEASRALQPWRSKCEVIPLGINLRQPPPATLRTELQWRPDTQLRLLSIGRLTYYKGFETLIKAVQAMPGVELVIAGEGELRVSLESLIRDTTPAGREPAVRLVGSVLDTEKHALLERCDVFCLASRERTEAFGIVLLEAMMHKRPCVVTDLPGSGMPWVVAHAHAGLHVPIEDVESWRSTLARLQHDTRLRTQFGEAGHQALLKYFDIAQCERALAHQYQYLALGSTPAEPNPRVLVVISTHNHAAGIQHLIQRVRSLVGADVLVVDNRSTDGTCHLAESTGATVLRPLLAMTTWGSLQTGLRYGLARGYDAVITIDAEGRYEVEEISSLLSRRQEGDVVVSHFSTRTSWARRLAWSWFRFLTGFALHDFVSGFRLYNRKALEVAVSTEATLLDYQDIGTLLLMRRRGLRIKEVALPMHTAKVDRSKIFQSWANALRYVAVSSLLCIAHWRGHRSTD